MFYIWLTIDISVSNITPMFLLAEFGIISQSPILITVMWFALLLRDDSTSVTVLSSFAFSRLSTIHAQTSFINCSIWHSENNLDLINQSITLVSLKRICIVQLMIYNIWDGHNKLQVNSTCIHYKNSSTG